MNRRLGVRRVGALVALSVAFVLLTATPAFAHAVLLQTTPGAGAVLGSAPRTVTLQYNEQVEASLGAVRVYDTNGNRVDAGTVSKPGANTVQVAIRSRLHAGAYVVTWRVISADSHPVQGAFTFQVGTAANATSPDVTGLAQRLLHRQGSDQTLGALYGVVRGAVFGGLALLLGATAFVVLLWPAGRASRRAARLAWTGWWLTFVATVAGILLQGPYGAGLALGDVFQPDLIRQVLDTRFGHFWALRLLLLLAAVLLLRPLFSPARPARTLPEWWRPAAAIVGVALATTPGLAGHAITGDYTGIALPGDVVHVLAMCGWLGGLAVLAFAVLPGRGVDELRAVVPRYSRFAFACVATLVLTGAFEAWRQVGSLDALRDTDYGQILMVKVLLFVVLTVVAALSRQIVGFLFPPSARVSARVPLVAGGADDDDVEWEVDESYELRRLRRSVLAEVLLAAAVIAATAVLVNAAPAKLAQARQGGATGITLKSDRVWIDVTAAPGVAPAANDIHVTAILPSGAPTNVQDLTATLDMPSRHVAPLTIPVRRLGPGHYLSPGFTIPFKGQWRLTVHALLDQFNEVTLVGTLSIV